MKPIRIKVSIPLEIDPELLLEGLRRDVPAVKLRRELANLLRAHFSRLDWTSPGETHAIPSYEELQAWLLEADLAHMED